MYDNPHTRYPLEGLSQRQPPSNIRAEQALLGALLANNRVLDKVGDILRPEHFADPMHGRIYAECSRRILAGQTADAVLLKEWFSRDADSSSVEGQVYLAQLLTAMILIDGVSSYAETIIDCWRRRQIIDALQHAVDRTFDFAAPISDTVEHHTSMLDAIVTDTVQGTAVTFDEAMQAAIERAEEARRRGGHAGVQIPTFARLAASIAFLPQEFTILAGQPGEGKSALGWQMLISAAEHVRDKVSAGTPISELGGFLGISLEMSKEAVATRALCAYSGVPVAAALFGRMTDEQAVRFREAEERLKKLPIEIIAIGGLTPTKIRMRLRQVRRKFKGKIALTIIDHVLLVDPDEQDAKSGGAWATGKIANSLLAMGKEFDCHMLGLCQIDIKDIAKRTDKHPTKADLRWSANWAQNADNILFIHRPEMYLPAAPPSRVNGMAEVDYEEALQKWRDDRERLDGLAELIIDKARSGRSGKLINLFFDKSNITFSEDPRQIDE